MIGYALLGLALLLYPYFKKWSLLLFIAFCCGGFQVLNQIVLGTKPADLAAIYTVVICVYSFFAEKGNYENDLVHKLFKAFVVFFVLSVLFSLFHYGFTLTQVVQGSRMHWTFLSFYFLQKTRNEDVEWIVNKIIRITIFVSVLYIIQVLTNLPVLPYVVEDNIDRATGIGRFYNYPYFLGFVIYAVAIFPDKFKVKRKNICLVILFLALLCTQGRTMMISLTLMLFIGLWLNGHRTKLLKIGIGLGIFLLPFADLISARFSAAGGSDSDIQAIINGSFKNDLDSRTGTGYSVSGGTMSYRFAWIYERAEYLSGRPLSENIFGLGMISESQTALVNRMYKFNLGLVQDNGFRTQISTPDISYGNFLTQFGYVGGFMLILFWISILYKLYINRNNHPIIFSTMLLVLFYFVNSLAGSTMSNMYSFGFPYLVLSLIYQKKNQKVLSVTV